MKTPARWRPPASTVRRFTRTTTGVAFILAACFSTACSSTTSTRTTTSNAEDSLDAGVTKPDFVRSSVTAGTADAGPDGTTTGPAASTANPSTSDDSSTVSRDDSLSTPSFRGDDAGMVEDGDDAPSWLFSLATSGRLHNIQDPTQRLVGVVDAHQASEDAKPWSKSGRRLAQPTSSGIAVYDVTTTLTLLKTIELASVTGVLRWIGEDRLLVSGSMSSGPQLWMVGLDGTVQQVGSSDTDAFITYHSLAPDASALVYSSPDQEGAYVMRHLRASASSSPTTLGVFRPSPMLSATWASTSQWLTFGISGPPDSGIYLWKNAPDAQPVRVSPEGAGYTPFLDFSHAGTHLAFVVISSGDTELRLAATGQNGASLLSSSAELAHPVWGADEWLAFSDADGGHLVQFAKAAPQRELPLVDYAGSCPLVWLSTNAVVYARCETDDQLLHASFDGTATNPTVTPRELGVAGHGLAKVGETACLLTWSDHALRLLDPNDSPHVASSLEVTSPKNVTVAPNGKGVAWSEGGRVKWTPIDNCAFIGPITLVDAHPTEVLALEFLGSNRR